ncbi:hypothetical protein EVAR_99611_1 [Eumeta japonica]|uniref:Uncharacterized protein n=1 Tax=Eumeta variegata TaxID=151549 RepID=A0A4C1SWV2_EUMVA|nr:hypothetical protein EVAR_99611_1 [Eumeta japonica]
MSSGLRRDCPGARVRLLTAPDSNYAEVYRAHTDEYFKQRKLYEGLSVVRRQSRVSPAGNSNNWHFGRQRELRARVTRPNEAFSTKLVKRQHTRPSVSLIFLHQHARVVIRFPAHLPVPPRPVHLPNPVREDATAPRRTEQDYGGSR